MVLSFALCVSFAFAQTSKVVTRDMAAKAKSVANLEAINTQVSYQGSIFSKENDTLQTFTFNTEPVLGQYDTRNAAPSTVLGRNPHGQTIYSSTWHRINNTQEMNSTTFAGNYPSFGSADYARFREYVWYVMDTAGHWGVTGNDGFMLMSCLDQQTVDPAKPFNAYFELGPIDATEAPVVDVRFVQFYSKFYDTCYIDYTDESGVWHSIEINVNGIDVEDINEWSRGRQLYTLPVAAAGHDQLKLRFRWYSQPYGANQAAYGYVWAIDNVDIRAGKASRLYRYTDHYVEGAYGMIPQGLQLPLSWFAPVKNNGIETQTGIEIQTDVLKYSDKSLISTVATGEHADMPFEPAIADTFVVDGRTDVAMNNGWLGYDTNYLKPGNANYTNNGLYTAVAGRYYATTTVATDDEEINGSYDTIPYEVKGVEAGDIYTWAVDNGLLLAGNYFSAGYVIENSNTYSTDSEGGYTKAGYGVSNRFATGNNVPEGWVIRGVELVPAITPNSSNYEGARISATLTADFYDGNSVYFLSNDTPLQRGDTIFVNTGANVYDVRSTDITTQPGFKRPGAYPTIRIMFPEQPKLMPNMAYRVGYQLEEEHAFAVATTGTSYASAFNGDTVTGWTSIYTDSTGADPMRPFYYNFGTTTYGIYLEDPTNTSRSGRFGYGLNQPLIRMLVGPAQPVERVNVTLLCDTVMNGDEELLNGGGRFQYNGMDSLCRVITPVKGSSPKITLNPFNSLNSYKVDKVWLDGNEISPYDPVRDAGDPDLVKDYITSQIPYLLNGDTVKDANGQPKTYLNQHEVYVYTFTRISGNHTLKASYKFVPNGIDPVRPDVQLSIFPNPANTSANVKIEGVTGKVNFALLDMSGRVVMNKSVDAEAVQTLNLNGLAKGAYFVRVTNNEFSKVEKLIVR